MREHLIEKYVKEWPQKTFGEDKFYVNSASATVHHAWGLQMTKEEQKIKFSVLLKQNIICSTIIWYIYFLKVIYHFIIIYYKIHILKCIFSWRRMMDKILYM